MIFPLHHLRFRALSLSKTLAAASLFLAGLATACVSEARTCESLFPAPRPELRLDPERASVKLTRKQGGYMGYEFLKGAPIFTEPDQVREYVNANPQNGNRRFPTAGNIDIDFLDGGWDEDGRTSLKAAEIFKAIRNQLPAPHGDQLIKYVDAVLSDARKRNYKFSSISIGLRTELYEFGFPDGHNHGHAGDLNYARAEMGDNTDVDSRNRFRPLRILPKDYISSNDDSTTIVFGDVWHRTPPLKPGAKRLYIIIELIP